MVIVDNRPPHERRWEIFISAKLIFCCLLSCAVHFLMFRFLRCAIFRRNKIIMTQSSEYSNALAITSKSDCTLDFMTTANEHSSNNFCNRPPSLCVRLLIKRFSSERERQYKCRKRRRRFKK